ncbi:MAG: zinc-binding dehydrogenase [Anaerolineaceae bacterium]|nr:zinc-binding dehydrogenase [Anaerolineaceae bacterium]
MNYQSICATRHGGVEVLQVMENDLRPPAPGEVRIKVLAASVSQPDITARKGEGLYNGTALGGKQTPPFVPGYSVIGNVDAVGEGVESVCHGERVGVLTVVGGYTEYLYWRADRLIPVPVELNPGDAVPLILNYIVAYQALHRKAKVRNGEAALIIGASGGIGTALLQLGQLAGLKLYGIASATKHAVLRDYGAIPIDYHTEDYREVLRQAEPAGIDVVLDGMMRSDYSRDCVSLLRRGGRMVSFGEPSGFMDLFKILGIVLKTNLLPDGKSYKLYGTSTYFLGDPRPYLEDWATLFKWMMEGKIRPVITQKFSLLEAARANQLLESGQVIGHVVLCAPECL